MRETERTTPAPESASPWWKTAPNPTCATFCTTDHEPSEFTDGGGFLCSRVLMTAPVAVEVQQFVGTTYAEDDYHRESACLYIERNADEFVSVIEAIAVASAILEGARLAAEVLR